MKVRIPKSLTEIAANEIRRMIITGELRFGAQLTEGVLATKFGLSKTPIREALLLLKREGLVTIHPRKGTFVFSPSAEELRSLIETRAIVEPGALRLSMRRNAVHLMKDVANNLERSNLVVAKADADKYLQLDTQFHALFFAYTENSFLDAFNNTIATKMHAIRYRLFYEKQFIERSIREHTKIFELICDKHIDEACHALNTHIFLCLDEDLITQIVNEGSGTCV